MPKSNVIVLAGPNGAGKTTAASVLLPGALGVRQFVNADTLASGLSAFDPESVAFAAGRLMLARLAELAAARESFAFETTLAARSFAPFLRELRESGYLTRLMFIALRDPELAVLRVAERVRSGGHNIPDDVIGRRFRGGLRNFFTLYQPIADVWRFYDNTEGNLSLVAERPLDLEERILQPTLWAHFRREGGQS